MTTPTKTTTKKTPAKKAAKPRTPAASKRTTPSKAALKAVPDLDESADDEAVEVTPETAVGGFSFTHLQTNTRTVRKEYPQGVLEIEYSPGAVSRARRRQFERISANDVAEIEQMDMVYDAIIDLVVSWNLTDPEGNAVPVTIAGIDALGAETAGALIGLVFEDMASAGNAKRRRTASGSSRTAR